MVIHKECHYEIRQKSFGYTATVRNINARKWYVLHTKYRTTRIKL